VKNSERKNEFVRYICNEIEIFLKNIGINYVNKKYSKNEDNVESKIKDFLKEIKKKWKKENPTKIQKVFLILF